ncbi:hypothetical protein [Paenibacillus sp. QZ-Y1]|uniref:hypothetical protein n=1 Tax=Paenibacillus sp. QZ-Y1 TaxID=3414511 RepID=UPI003F78FDD2
MIIINTVLNERYEAEEILKSGKVDKYPRKTINSLAKYYVAEGYALKETEDSIDEFLKTHMPKYNSVLWYKEIAKIVQSNKNRIKKRVEANKEPLIEVEEVVITQDELDSVQQLKSIRLEKIAFSFLVYAKVANQKNNKNTYWVNEDVSEVMKDAGIKDGLVEQNRMMNKLIQLEYLETPFKAASTSYRVTYGNEDSKAVITIKDFTHFIYEYLRYKGENVGNCEECGRLIVKNSNRQKRCKVCQKNYKRKNNTRK